jgi:hypothetical protein
MNRPRRLVISEHALHRFAERHPEVDDLEPGQSRQVFLEELERGVPFGGQVGDDELRLLPCGLVAAVTWTDGVGVVKTVLTKELAIANMQSQGVVPERFRPRRPLRRAADPAPPVEPEPDPVEADPLLEATMRQLAEDHLREGIGKKERNAQLRELGYDPNGPAGEVYRDLLRTARAAKLAADREQAFRDRWRGQGMTPAELTDFAARYTAAWCSHESLRVAEFFAEQGSLTINRGAPAIGRVAIAAAAQGFMTAFPNLVVVMDSVGAIGPTVFYRWTLTGTNTGPAGTGRRVRISGYEEWTFGPDGLIARPPGYFDEASYQAQLLEAGESS